MSVERSNSSERLWGPWSILANARVSNRLRMLIGRSRVVKTLSREYITARQGDTVIDFGCGLAGILPELSGVEYVGVDVDENHMEAAAKRFSGVGQFRQMDLLKAQPSDFVPADIVLARGFFHHLDDGEAGKILDLACSVLKPGGRLITIDPVKVPRQNPIARFLVNIDRGRHVRTADEYRSILQDKFEICTLDIRNDLLRVPYAHCVVVASAKSNTSEI